MSLYDVHNLGADFSPVALNNRGVVAGNVNLGNGLFGAARWQGGTRMMLASPSRSSWVGDINDAGQVVGRDMVAGSCVWTAAGTFEGLGLPLFNGVARNEATAINAKGVICGNLLSDQYDWLAYRFDSGGLIALQAFHFRGATDRDYATDIDAKGTVVGYSGANDTTISKNFSTAARWSAGGNFEAIDNPQTAPPDDIPSRWSWANRSNDSGLAVGGTSINAESTVIPLRAAFWGTSQKGLLPDPGSYAGSEAFDVNTAGQIVGWGRYDEFGGLGFATIWNGPVITRLNDLIDANSGWRLEKAICLNDHGQFAGTGSLNGQTCGWMMSPSQELARAKIPPTFLQILFGVRNDGRGVIVKPGGTVGPGPGGPLPDVLRGIVAHLPAPYHDNTTSLLRDHGHMR